MHIIISNLSCITIHRHCSHSPQSSHPPHTSHMHCTCLNHMHTYTEMHNYSIPTTLLFTLTHTTHYTCTTLIHSTLSSLLTSTHLSLWSYHTHNTHIQFQCAPNSMWWVAWLHWTVIQPLLSAPLGINCQQGREWEYVVIKNGVASNPLAQVSVVYVFIHEGMMVRMI